MACHHHDPDGQRRPTHAITILGTRRESRRGFPFNYPLIESIQPTRIICFSNMPLFSCLAWCWGPSFQGFTAVWDLKETSDCSPQRLQVHGRMCVAQGLSIHWCISFHTYNHLKSTRASHIPLDMIEYTPAHKTYSQQRFICELEYSAIIPQLNTGPVTAQRLLPPCALLQTAQIRQLTHDARSLP